MLWFVGMGVYGYKGLSLYALEVLQRCRLIYVENFTSEISDEDLKGLQSLTVLKDVEIVPIKRWFVEDGRSILDQAKMKDLALLSYGDPLIATTHLELYTRAIRNSIQTDIVHGASGLTSLIGETGLHFYKFGRCVTMMSEPQSAISVYNVIHDNLLSGNHTLILTEYNYNNSSQPYFLDPVEVLERLLDIENSLKYGILSEETYIVVASRVGTEHKKIISGKLSSLSGISFGMGPHSLIVTGRLHFTEHDAITSLRFNIDEPSDNTLNISRISARMVDRYAPKAKRALEHIRMLFIDDIDFSADKPLQEYLNNAECYIDDAENFLKQGKHELAVLSMGYAEGLIDALRYQKGLNPWFS